MSRQNAPTKRSLASPDFAARVVIWQREHGRHDLPWQNTRDPYRIWLSEIMLQQTQVATVLGYYERFLKACPTVTDLAYASDDTVMVLWAGLGYYTRARNLHKTAKIVVENYHGNFPNDANALAQLPGIGRSTAAAIAAFSFDTIAAILDGNVKRVLARHAGVEGFPATSAVEKKLWLEAESRLPTRAGDMVAYSQGLMDLGATICSKGSPSCMRCPVNNDCVARIEARIDDIPAARPSKALPHKTQRYLLAVHANSVLLVKRPPQGIWGGLWCLPELSEQEDALHAAQQRFGATTLFDVQALQPFDHTFTHFRLTLQPTLLKVAKVATGAAEADAQWLVHDELHRAGLPKPISRLLAEPGLFGE
jgi:A/G-specific adenine glycosylase